jgi:AraC-like DNA-binding protein
MRQIPEEYLVKKEQDIQEAEGIFVHTPSAFALETLFYIRLEALYTCGPRYEVKRAGLNSFLMFYIKEGELLFEYEGRTFVARNKDIVVLDCMKPQRYQALTRTSFYWFHFDGSASRAYFEHFRENRGIHFQNTRKMEEQFVLIHDLMRSGCPDEGIMSVHLHRIMALLFSSAGTGGTPSDVVARAKVFMDAHYMEKLSAEQIADASRVSPSHLFRLFRRETGLTPYAYLTNVRMEHAMKMLLNTSYTVEEIAYYCAFCSSANFIRAFRQTTGVTPRKYRKLISGITSAAP